MTDTEAAINIRDHGTVLDQKKNRVQCNYCSKVVSGFFRLRCHLGGVRGDVTPCEEVPASVKEPLRNELLERKKENPTRGVGEQYHWNIPLKRNKSPHSVGVKRNKNKEGQTLNTESGNTEEADSLYEDERDECDYFPCRRISPQPPNSREYESSSRRTKKLIGRFFYETGIDFSAADSLSFQRMINHIAERSYHLAYEIPNCLELKGWILQEEVAEMQESINNIKSSWENRGCSILLDGWVDEKGRNLVKFLVDCPRGPIYLRSSDISAIAGNVEALQSLLDEVVEEVGFKNVVQVVASSTYGWMGAVGKQFMEKHRGIFWTISASHCIGLILEKIVMVDSTRNILDRAKIITRLIYGHEEVCNLFRNHGRHHGLTKPFKIKSAMPFIALENIVSEKQRIIEIFSSSEWNNSIWTSEEEGKKVMELVKDFSFWVEAEMVLKATIPLVQVLHWIDESDKPHAGYLYETMDQAKETIKKELRNIKSSYMPIWRLIDDIWNTHLHSPLHAAGYYLNPNLFYTGDFYCDAEVTCGLLCSIVRMVEDKNAQDLLTLQLYKYTHAKGAFEEGSKANQRTNTHPVLWWSKYGKDCPELQSFAIRVLSQTCDGASRYRLKRTMAEKLLAKGTNCPEQQHLIDLTFVHYNMQLLQYKPGVKRHIVVNEVDQMNEWIDERPESGSRDSELIRMDSGRSGHSGLQAKAESAKDDAT